MRLRHCCRLAADSPTATLTAPESVVHRGECADRILTKLERSHSRGASITVRRECWILPLTPAQNAAERFDERSLAAHTWTLC